MISIRHLPNIITFLRILGSAALLLLKPLSAVFFLVYFLCGLSDILDGALARKTGNVSRLGSVLDSISDFVFVAVLLLIFIPVLHFTGWMLGWTIGVALVRILSLTVGYFRYRTVAFLHTYANKATGLLLFCFPLLLRLCGMNGTAAFLLTVASLSAAEDLMINLTSSALHRDVKSLFWN